MEKQYINRVATTAILAILAILSFFLLKPILISIITGMILALMLFPLHKRIKNKLKSDNLSASVVSLLLIILVLIPIWFLVPILLKQSMEIYLISQQMDFITPLKSTFPSLFSSPAFEAEIGSAISSLITKVGSGVTSIFSNLLLNFPTLFLQFLVLSFTFFFCIKDGEKFVSYLQSILPFPKNVERKLFKSSKDITFSVINGQVVFGIVQGLIVGIGFFLLGINNALFLTILACLAGIFPIIGTSVIWIPVAIYLLISGNPQTAIGLSVFGLITLILENSTKPIFVAKKTNVHSSVILLGMIGGMFFFGIIGVVIGPLILSYLLIVLDIYRDKKTPNLFIKKENGTKN